MDTEHTDEKEFTLEDVVFETNHDENMAVLRSIEDRILRTGKVDQFTMEAIAQLVPDAIDPNYPVSSYTKNPSNINLEQTLESVSWGKVLLAGAAIASVAAVLYMVFKHLKNKDVAKSIDDSIKVGEVETKKSEKLKIVSTEDAVSIGGLFDSDGKINMDFKLDTPDVSVAKEKEEVPADKTTPHISKEKTRALEFLAAGNLIYLGMAEEKDVGTTPPFLELWAIDRTKATPISMLDTYEKIVEALPAHMSMLETGLKLLLDNKLSIEEMMSDPIATNSVMGEETDLEGVLMSVDFAMSKMEPGTTYNSLLTKEMVRLPNFIHYALKVNLNNDLPIKSGSLKKNMRSLSKLDAMIEKLKKKEARAKKSNDVVSDDAIAKYEIYKSNLVRVSRVFVEAHSYIQTYDRALKMIVYIKRRYNLAVAEAYVRIKRGNYDSITKADVDKLDRSNR